ncbi:MAG TPA: amidohydrolase family protein, partial [Gemmatimonadales bacterium]|nr:amidohydrolase family protein [Gemmatimonadales bacterium]
LAIRELVEPGILSLPDLLARMSTVPARVFQLPGGSLAVGAPADLVIIDPTRRWVVRREQLHSKSANSPFLGETLVGQADATIVAGRVVFQRAPRSTS